ncbi:IclR family transcriptional regulator C-terminal domain-containing protein [Streptomyces sp. NPDC091371]|uniref:IclR family transcriptional regulator C-terminal domain-containing protein n=1 Tax=Streptomyces sp. NPDC091371 TaxID=3155303 RepID=UPI00342AD653
MTRSPASARSRAACPSGRARGSACRWRCTPRPSARPCSRTLPPQQAAGLVGAAERERLDPELDGVRARGYAVDDEGHEPAVRCLGTPVFDREGRPVGGLSLTTAASLTTREELERLAPALREAARGVEALLQRG